MFSKIFYYFLLVFLVANSSQVFSTLSCEDGFARSRYSTSTRDVTIGVESYRQLLTRLAQSILGVDSLSPQQVKALETYHDVVRGEIGEDGEFARVGKYTFSQRRRIVRFLREVFSPEQVTILIEDGVVEINRSSDVKITRRVFKTF